MRRAWKISSSSHQRSNLFIQNPISQHPRTLKPLTLPTSSTPQTPFRFLLLRNLSNCVPSIWPETLDCLTTLFGKSRASDPGFRKELFVKVLELKDELVKVKGEGEGDSDGVFRVLDEMGLSLFVSNLDGSAFIMLLEELRAFPHLALEVFDWRRKHASFNFPITSEEYCKGITVAGRDKNINLAVELFTEASNNRAKTSSTYNALMTAYKSNSMPEQCQMLFWELKREKSCYPTTITYNILISVFGHLMLVDHMEATFQQIYDSNLFPNVNTFNDLIAGYITAWMWDRMESTYSLMKENFIEPNTSTHMLLLRGYSHAGNLEKMEEMYELIRNDPYRDNDVLLIRVMICAYCRTPSASKIKRIEELMDLIPEKEYCSWLNVLLIKFYANLQLLERMEFFINVALERKTDVVSTGVMRSVITAYYRSSVVDRLTGFVEQAERAGWKLCRSIYHCKMVMYGSQNRLDEMESVLARMEKYKLQPTKKTFVIMYKAYSNWGPRYKVEQLVGLMCKNGYGILLDVCPS